MKSMTIKSGCSSSVNVHLKQGKEVNVHLKQGKEVNVHVPQALRSHKILCMLSLSLHESGRKHQIYYMKELAV